ncbi:MAG: DUF1844 domain-containing protein [Planctomycetaceae bacterium]|nr:DUF1844 domain-containing protein [Planctomycetaceae bacterium]
MTDPKPKKLIVDDDWKSQVEREKEELAAKESPKQAQQSDLPDASFLNHIASLATQVMVLLGLVEHPVIGKRVFDGEQARFLIDTIVMLREKAKGNLTPEESTYVERIIPELQMTFVEVSKAVAQMQAEDARGASGVPGADIKLP